MTYIGAVNASGHDCFMALGIETVNNVVDFRDGGFMWTTSP